MGNMQGIAFALLALGSTTAVATAMPKNAEASLTVTGTVTVAPDGSVSDHAIDHPEQLDTGIVGMIDQSMKEWRFKPMHASASATMRLVIDAKKTDDGKYRIRISGADFESKQDSAHWAVSTHRPPNYPQEALLADVGGTAYVYVRVDNDGKVLDTFVGQVDLSTSDSRVRMDHWRSVLGDASANAAKAWQFKPLSDDRADGSASQHTVMVPVQFFPGTETMPKYGQWRVQLPGPSHEAPWLAGDDTKSMRNPEALAANGVYSMQRGAVDLITPLSSN